VPQAGIEYLVKSNAHAKLKTAVDGFGFDKYTFSEEDLKEMDGISA
jgi:hypothetical protein